MASPWKATQTVCRAFITGSRVYGTPTDLSDWDLVLLVEPDVLPFLESAETKHAYDDGDHSLLGHGILPEELAIEGRIFGPLNLILCTEPEIYNAWLNAKNACLAEAPVERERAIEIHEHYRKIGVQMYEDRVNGKTKGRRPTYTPKQGGPQQALHDTHYCRKCKSTPCKCPPQKS